jgi:hypothetical protein
MHVQYPRRFTDGGALVDQAQALDRWCGGRPDEQTLALIDAGG